MRKVRVAAKDQIRFLDPDGNPLIVVEVVSIRRGWLGKLPVAELALSGSALIDEDVRTRRAERKETPNAPL